MKDEDCKLPIQEEHRNFLDKHNTVFFGSKKIAIIAAFLLLIAMSLMTAFTFQSLNGISELKREVENLKISIKVLQKKIDANHDDRNGPTSTTTTPEYDDFVDEDIYPDLEEYDEEETYEDDLPNEYYDNEGDTPDNIVPLTGEQFTKDAKTATIPPRSKRSIIGYSHDGTPVNSETDNETRRRNNTIIKNHFSTPAPPSSYSYPFYPELRHQDQTTPGSRHIHSRRLRVYHNDNPQNNGHTINVASALKSGPSQSSEEHPEGDFTVAEDDQFRNGHTRHRQRRIVPGRIRPLPTAHFSGDTSRYVLGHHENYKGNGHLRHPQRTFVDWSEKNWVRSLGMDRYFSLSDGFLTIKDSGLYFIYVQIFYFDVHDVSGFRVYRNENETLLQCTTTSHSNESVLKGNTCFTAAAEYLNENDRISIEDLQSRYSLFEPGKSFFGLIQLGDVKIK